MKLGLNYYIIGVGDNLPTISMFFGIIIRMYCDKSEHNPPHFHAYYGEYKSIVDINKCEVIDENISRKQLKLIEAWAELPYKIEPLK